MVVLPADIVGEILSRLPVKPLLRSRSVCKIWCALIDSNHFIKLHLRRSIDTKTNWKFIIKSLRSIHSISLDSLDVAEKLDYPTGTSNGGLLFFLALCSCNGLLLLWTCTEISILNPSTRKCQILPPPKTNNYPRMSCCLGLGFGYDAVNDDYKVVIKRSHDNEMMVQVYSLNSNSWRVIKDFPYLPHKNGFEGVLAHGALNFRVTINNNEEADHDCSIAAFDLATEETRLVQLPEFGGNNVYMDLAALEGCLCIVAYGGVVGLGSYRMFLGVWVMKDDGVGGSWNKLISAAQLSVMGSFDEVFPLAYSKNAREVLLVQDKNKFIWFDLENNAIRKIQVQGLPSNSTFRAQAFVQSLVPPSSGGETNPEQQVIRDEKEKRQEDIGMKRSPGQSEPITDKVKIQRE